MSVEQIEKTLLELPTEERRQFADWFFQHENEIIGSNADEYIHPSVKAELLRRLKEVEEHPELLEPWDGTLKRARQQLDEFRRSQNQPR
ncbi:MAG: hypothetical protein PHY43_06690 [Verrucomicrobiales bacterium]|nr:hypothetical protein [Verrucomicrobiales bacterium]